ncbi:helix-turn-helix domain-containing protein [Cohnella sp. JJ-181]|uniref:helix-turn-helix domain-containing protein n=1 Tax=Cohnella rhizoplanae TaxID=2974897 RepID=UPI0022FFB3DB|nr:helix-turn-helix domain-containing protein [Cohnella sp. JJ-181]CAI6087345.1 HTH-type transcriptional activator RhaR [Cohnella sp. JJ-181]
MHNVVIVDDEMIVSRGLSEKVDWRQLECNVVGIGSNGLEGKSLIDQHHPDIVITDIKMPGMNGLDLAQYVKERYPESVTILLSGYTEFDYARTAVRHQVFDYLLKPVDLEDLKNCIHKAKKHLAGIGAVRKKGEWDQEAAEKRTALAESGILLNIIVNGNKDIGILDKKMNEMGLQLRKGQTVVFERYERTDDPVSASLFQYAIQNIVSETYDNLNIRATVFNHEGQNVAVIKYNPDIQPVVFERRVLEATEMCNTNIGLYLKRNVNIGFGKIFDGIQGLHASYRSASAMLEDNLFWGIHDTFRQPDQATRQDAFVSVDARWLEAVSEGNEEDSRRFLDRFLHEIRGSKNKTCALNGFMDFLVGLTRHLSDKDMKALITRTITEIPSIRTFKDYQAALTRTMETVCRQAKRDLEDMAASLGQRTLNYIDSHYQDPDLSLQFIAENYHVSDGHLSRLFKKETGATFSEYLIKKRVDKAKELLDRDQRLTVTAVAGRVGFTDAKYFGQVFKKYYGSTPSEYKQQKNG